MTKFPKQMSPSDPVINTDLVEQAAKLNVQKNTQGKVIKTTNWKLNDKFKKLP